MPKFVMPSGAENGKVYKEEKCKNLAVLAERRDLNVCCFQLSFQAATLKQWR